MSDSICLLFCGNNRTVVVAQLVEQSLLIPEVHGWNPVIGKIYFVYYQLL